MSSHDRPGQSDEGWKQRQDLRAEENIRRFHVEFKDDQGERLELNKGLAETIERLVDNLNGLSGNHEDPHPLTGEVHQHDSHDDVPVGDHPQITDFVVPGVIATVVVVNCLNKVLEAYQDKIQSLGEQGIDGIKALGASIAETWDQFKADTEQAIEDVKQEMTELVSERTQDRPPAEPEKSTEIGGPQVDKDIKEIRDLQDRQELQDKQEREQAELAAKMDERREQLAEKYEGSPEQEKLLQQFNEAAEKAAEALARQQEAAMQRLLEQQQQRMQEMQDRNR